MRSAPYQLPASRVATKPPLNLRLKENLVQIAAAFDKAIAARVKQMNEINSVSAARFYKKMKLNNLQVHLAVLKGCGDPRVSF